MQRVSTFFVSFVLGLGLLATSGCEDMSADKKPGERSSDGARQLHVSRKRRQRRTRRGGPVPEAAA